jgi:hypothetical protein
MAIPNEVFHKVWPFLGIQDVAWLNATGRKILPLIQINTIRNDNCFVLVLRKVLVSNPLGNGDDGPGVLEVF